jgi:hypothetical protein
LVEHSLGKGEVTSSILVIGSGFDARFGIVESFEQATIKVEKQAEFEQLRTAIDRAFNPENVGKFLGVLKNKGLRVRDWDAVLARRVLETKDETLRGTKAKELYDSLTVSDKSQVREFYLFRVEEVDPKLRTKFHKIYQYY